MKMKMLLALVCVVIGSIGGTGEIAAQALRVGDSFDLRIGGVPSDDQANISSTYTIDGDGFMNIAYLSKVHVAGLTASQVQSVIERAYEERGIFTRPTITLNVAASAKFVNVSGQVKNPSRVPFTPDMTVMSAINAAGDFTDYAKQNRVHLVHGNSVRYIDCKKARQNPALDLKVEPGDSIMVEQSIF